VQTKINISFTVSLFLCTSLTSCIIFSFAATISVACSFGGIAACDEEDFKLSALKRTVAQNPCPFWQYSGDNPTSRKPDFRSDLQQDVPTCP